MNYFEDVYLKRVNRYGNDLQSRIHGKMKHDFANMLQKSVNKVNIYNGQNIDSKKIGLGIIQSKNISEKEIIDYLLTDKADVYKNGTILFLENDNMARQAWMVLFLEPYLTVGYNKYKIILLENKIEWLDNDNVLRTSLAHYTSNGGSRDKAIVSNFKISFENVVNLPNRNMNLVLPYTSFLKRGNKMNISDTTWEVSGYDKESVPGVMYVTLEETYSENHILINEKLYGWSFTSNLGNPLFLTKDNDIEVAFQCSYNGIEEDREIYLEDLSNNTYIEKLSKNNFMIRPLKSGNITIKVGLEESKDIFEVFELMVSEQQEPFVGISVPNRLRVGQQIAAFLSTNYIEGEIEISSKNNYFTIDKIDNMIVYLTGKTIGQDIITVKINNEVYETPIEIISMWM